jgi:hypothetical protein
MWTSLSNHERTLVDIQEGSMAVIQRIQSKLLSDKQPISTLLAIQQPETPISSIEGQGRTPASMA